MTQNLDNIINELKELNLLEASELVKKIEEVFGVDSSVSAGVVMSAAPISGNTDDQNAVEEKNEFDVIIEKVPADKKIPILKIVRNITGLGLKEARALVDELPKTLKEKVAKEEAENIKQQFEEAGAEIALK